MITEGTRTTDIKASIADKVARFDFSAHKEFRDTTEPFLLRDEVSELDVDLAAVNYVDSSALGMLPMLRDKTRNARREIRLSRCSPPVRQVLDIVNFGKLFRID